MHPYEWGILGIKALDFYPLFDCADCSHCSCCCGDFCGSDRVVVARDDRSMYEGAKGKVIKVKGQNVSIEFDKPVRENKAATFSLAFTFLMKL